MSNTTIALYCIRIGINDKEQAYELIFSFNNTSDQNLVEQLTNYDPTKVNPSAHLLIINLPFKNTVPDELPSEDNWYYLPTSYFETLQEYIVYPTDSLFRYQLR